MTTQPTVKFFRKKPIPVPAIEWTGSNLRKVIEFTGLHPSAQKWTWEEYEAVVEREGLKIFTREGALMAQIGDWIMRGVKGEFWPIKPDILSETYDEVQEPANTPNDKTEIPGERLLTTKYARNARPDILSGFRELAEVRKENEQLREVLVATKELGLKVPGVNALCHRGISEQSECGHCSRIARLVTAIAKADKLLPEEHK